MKDESHYAHWLEEIQSAFLYDVLSRIEKDPQKQALFTALGASARGQAAIWRNDLTLDDFKPSFRMKSIALLLRCFGPRPLMAMLAAAKVRGLSVYRTDLSEHAMPTHVDDIGGRHRRIVHGNQLRAAVFGINDGLLSNSSLIIGMIGAAANSQTVLLSGIAGLVAGAFSMAAGEFVSVQAQKELLDGQLALERDELAEYPQEEAAELALIYTARGMPAAEAQHISNELVKDPERALITLAREELGIDPAHIADPWQAAYSSFAAFAVGALIPLVALWLWPLSSMLWGVGFTAAISLAIVGALTSLFSGQAAWPGAIRLLAIGGLAMLVTYCAGQLFQ